MNNNIHLKLWVVKFCLKLVYPKFNYYTFLVFLAIKYRLRYSKRLLKRRGMEIFEIKSISPHVHRKLIKGYLDDNLFVLAHKCILISKEQFVELVSENLFYIDNGVLWLTLKLSQGIKRRHTKTNKSKKNNIIKFNLNIVTSEIHKKLWADDNTVSLDNIRVVPVVGSKLVQQNVALVTENEFYNIVSSFGLDGCKNVEVTFHPIPSFENAPIIAATAEVNLVVNEDDLPNDYIKEVLSNYFETPKILSTNDVFSIDLTPTITAKYHYKYSDLERSSGKLYFKCGKLTSYSTTDTTNSNSQINRNNIIQVYFIVKNVTQLTLGENIHALKPKDEYLRPQEIENNIGNLYLCPTGLREKFEQMQETISPFITGDMNDLSSSMSNPIIPMLLLTGPTGSGRHLIVQTLAKYNGMNCLQTDCNALQSSTAKQTERKINSTVQKAKASAPVIVMLNNFEVFAIDSEQNEDCRIVEYFINSITDLYQNYTKHPIILIAVTEKFDLKPNISRMFLEKFHMPTLNVQQRFEMLQWFASVMQLDIDGDQKDTDELVDLESKEILSKSSKDVLQRVAAKTETFLYGDLDTLVHFALRESYLKQLNSCNPSSDPQLQLVKEEDFNLALESIRSLQSQHLDAPKIPKVYWEDIGGLNKLKKELLKTIEFPIKYPHLFKNCTLKRSGILLYGPPGCGKTLVAKAVSTELKVSFLSVKGPELLNMYIGQSEENVRQVFERARASSPCIVFLDELDALAPRRGAAGDSGGASDRVVSQLLAELDGVNSAGDIDTSFVFIMGATNRPDLLEQSLLRPGRLDKLIYVGPYTGLAEKTSVLNALCRSYKLRPEVNLEDVAAALPDRCTGADLLQVVSTARSTAVRALVAKLHSGAVKESDLSPNSVILGVSELWQGVQCYRPSVTDDELAYYESLQSQI